MSETHDDIRAAAIAWLIRLHDGSGDDDAWDDFADWLAADPRHGAEYDAIERLDRAIEPLLPDLKFNRAANDAADDSGDGPDDAAGGAILHTARRRRSWFAGGALAASIALALAVTVVPRWNSDRYEVSTGAGENQIVTLDPATRITLNGSTRMAFDRRDPRFASLIVGEALFHVRHDAARPFRLEIGGDVVEDAGTVFNVTRDAGGLRVAVDEGKVVYNPGRQAVSLAAGQALFAEDSASSPQVITVPAGSVGAWQRGQLVYAGEPLSQVAADMSRSLGIKIVAASALADQQFYGTLALDGSGPEQLRHLQQALDVILEPNDGGWAMKPRNAGAR